MRVDIDELIEKLRSPSERLIKIIVADNAERPLHVQQQVLESLSSYFVGALKRDAFEEGRSGVLTFPEDEADVWDILLYWIMCHELPNEFLEDDLLLAVRCWTTGDKYGVKAFQDAIMLLILRRLNWCQITGVNIDPDAVRISFERTTQKSLLRKLFLEYVTVATAAGPTMADVFEATFADLENLDGSGFYPAAMSMKALCPYEMSWKWAADDIDQPGWKDFFLLKFEGYSPPAEKEDF